MSGEDLFTERKDEHGFTQFPMEDLNPGTTYQGNAYTGWNIEGGNFHPVEDEYHAFDERNRMYGRGPGAADTAVGKAWFTGQGAQDFGMGVYGNAMGAAEQLQNRAAQTGNWGQQNAALAGADSYGNQLAGLEAQQGPSAAQAQLQQGTNQAMGSQIAMARSGRGFGGGAGAAGLAQSNLAGIQANQANQAGALRAQEDAAWRQRQAANFGAAANIQQGIGQQYGGQAQADLSSYYQNQGQNDAAALGWGQAGIGAGQAGFQTNLAGQQIGDTIRGRELDAGLAEEDRRLRVWAAANGHALGEAQRQDQKEAGYWSAGGNFLGQLLSDVRAKKDIVRTDEPALEFARAGSMVSPQQPDFEALDAVAAAPGYGYKYIDPSGPGAADGQQYGPMAQDLASTPAGSTAVVEMPNGKLGVDPARLTTLNTAALSAQQQELDEVKAQLALFQQQPGAVYPRSSHGSF